MRQAEFAELSREVMPVLDKLTEIAGQHMKRAESRFLGLILRKCRKQSVRRRESERRDWRQSWKASTANLRRRKMRDE